jgi:hypothetical protein
MSDKLRDRQGYNEAQKARIENIGILVASGLIAGEAMVGLVVATFNFANIPIPVLLPNPSFFNGLLAMALIIFVMLRTPLANPGKPDEPAPPTAMM